MCDLPGLEPYECWDECQASHTIVGKVAPQPLDIDLLGRVERHPEQGIQTPMAQGGSTKIISTNKWIRTSRLSIQRSLSVGKVEFSSDAQRGHLG